MLGVVAGGGVVAAGFGLLLTLLALEAGAHQATAKSTPNAASPSVASVQVRAARVSVVARIPAFGTAVSVPRSFLGLSTEYWTIPVWAKHLSALGQVLSAITAYGPMVLRIGGSSADQAVFAPTTELPEWAFEITPGWLRQLRQIIDRFGVRVILDLNTVTATPAIAIRWARAAEGALPTESIVGFEIGNEPDIYSPAAWRRFAGGVMNAPPLPNRITASSYASSFRSYGRALVQMDRGVPLFGPALADPRTGVNWISALLADAHPGLRAVTVHRYPMSACSHSKRSRTFPTIARLLGDSSTAGMASTIKAAVRIARRAGLPVRLTEMNSVTCGGRKGVSDTFATALWAPDALFELLKAGASSAAVHVRANAINMAFSLTRRGLVANPLMYGLALFSRMLGPTPQLLPLKLSGSPSVALNVWAVRVGGNTLHVLVINKSTRTATLSLHIPATGPVTAQDLLARTARATTGVTLDGQHLNPQGQWTGTPAAHTINPGAGEYQVTVRGISATIVTANLSAGSLAGLKIT